MKILVNTIALICLVVFQTCNPRSSDLTSQSTEIRGVWLTNVDSDVLLTRKSISAAMQFLKDNNFNVVFPVVWNYAKTLYPSEVMDSLFGASINPLYKSRDPLLEVIEESHIRGIKIIPWFEYGFSSSHKKNGGIILNKRPEWSAKDVKGNLLTKNGFEWMNAYHSEVQNFLLSLVLEVVTNYDIDGIQGDDRLPAQPVEGGYSAYTVDLYQSSHNGMNPRQDCRDPEWMRWRADRLNGFAERLYREVKSVKPDIIVS